jgi:hypothetical protein
MTTIKYSCINCHCSLTMQPFRESDIGKEPPMIRCPLCQHICAPEAWIEANRNERGMIDMQAFYRRWSNCPNAYKCELHDQYASDCEDGRLMQKCLVALHAEAECATHFAREAAQPKPKRQSRKAPGSNASES